VSQVRTETRQAFDPDNYIRSNPQAMAGLTGSGTDPNSRSLPTGRETRERILRDATRRSKGVLIFYQGLKEFAGDRESRLMLDRMISEEDRHIRLLTRSPERRHVSVVEAGSEPPSRTIETVNHLP